MQVTRKNSYMHFDKASPPTGIMSMLQFFSIVWSANTNISFSDSDLLTRDSMKYVQLLFLAKQNTGIPLVI